jgi:Frequency clock protein
MDESHSRPDSLLRSHPRRRPAAESVSLIRKSLSPPPQLDSEENGSSASSMRVDAASDILEKPACQKDSSGESSNPEKWFEKTNNKVKPGNASIVEGKRSRPVSICALTLEDEPPFFLRNSSSDTTPPNVLQQREREQRELAPMLAHGADSSLLAPETSASEEFRSVIDDLTIENKRLKKRLRRYERGQRSMLYPETLFELRVHGLASDKKRELEKLLQDFVGHMGKSPSTNFPSISGSAVPSMPVPSSLLPEHQSSSNSRIGDSGYVSMSLSGQNSSNKSGQRVKDPDPNDVERKQDIQDYLTDIPKGLLPRRSGPLTEKEKRKIVVRKIEQIFAGRDSAAIGHQQSIQQQHVARSAARAERRATETAGTLDSTEGSREARIMSDTEPANDKKDSSNHDSLTSSALDSMEGDSAFVEQRPTRPLDLDPSRAQVPAENMQYLRHLGFSPPDQTMSPHADGHGWIHLNVLMNLAQTHFEHVTVDFVRKAILESSKRLEVSSDGRKARWMGGQRVTSSNNSPYNDDNGRSTSSGNPFNGSAPVPPKKLSASTNSSHKLSYSPLFHQREDSEMADADEDMTYDQSHGAGHSPGFTSSAKRVSTPGNIEAKVDAPIIFYQNPHFYADMSHDTVSGNRKPTAYSKLPVNAVGEASNLARSDLYRRMEVEKGPLSGLGHGVDVKYSLLEKPSRGRQQGGELRIIARSATTSSVSSQTVDPIELQASGIGGVMPADNFAISVRSRQNADVQRSGENQSFGTRRKGYAPRIRNLLRDQSTTQPGPTALSPKGKGPAIQGPVLIQREIIGSKRRELPASKLPDAVFFYGSSDEDDEDEDMDDDSDMESSGESAQMPHSAPQPLWGASHGESSPSSAEVVHRHGRSFQQHKPTLNEDSDEEDDDEEENEPSDESIDLLQNARAVDPLAVRAKEREFDRNITERMTDEIPAGSSAATADGGSGFNSPAILLGHMASGATGAASSTPRMMPTPRLKRQRKSDDDEQIQGSRAHKSPRMEG